MPIGSWSFASGAAIRTALQALPVLVDGFPGLRSLGLALARAVTWRAFSPQIRRGKRTELQMLSARYVSSGLQVVADDSAAYWCEPKLKHRNATVMIVAHLEAANTGKRKGDVTSQVGLMSGAGLTATVASHVDARLSRHVGGQMGDHSPM